MKPITSALSNVSSVDDGSPSIGVRFALKAIRAYKVLLSPYFAGSCRFLPSCADYAAEAVIRHGVGRGTWLAVRRLARCHPLCAAGHDPVPVGPMAGDDGLSHLIAPPKGAAYRRTRRPGLFDHGASQLPGMHRGPNRVGLARRAVE